MLSPKMMKLIKRADFKQNVKMRALASYYRTKVDAHPDPQLSGHYVIVRNPNAKLSDHLEYVRLANADGTLAVFRITNRGELKRLKRWPESIEDGTAQTSEQFEAWCDSLIEEAEVRAEKEEALELDYLLDGFDGLEAA